MAALLLGAALLEALRYPVRCAAGGAAALLRCCWRCNYGGFCAAGSAALMWALRGTAHVPR